MDDSLQKIVKGTGTALVGTFFGLLLQFLTRILLVRYGTQSEFGAFSLSLTVFSLLTVLAGVGMYEGMTRYTAYLRGKGQLEYIRQLARDAILLPLLTSVVVAVVLFMTSEFLASWIFRSAQLALPFRVLSVGLPLITLVNSIAAIYRGFDRVGPQMIFQTIVVSGLFLVLSSAIIMIKLQFDLVYYAYVLSMAISLILFIIYSGYLKEIYRQNSNPRRTNGLRRELIIFSLPIMGTALLYALATSMDTLILGFVRPVAEVGIYSAAYTMAGILTVFLAAFQLVFVPISSGLFSRNMLAELKRNYIIATKWLTSATFPLFLVLFLFPDAVLNSVFGSNYVGGADAMRVLLVGCILSNLLSPSAGILIAVGTPKYNLYGTALAVAMNIIMSAALIPGLGILGAAVASAVSMVLLNTVCAVVAFIKIRAVPMSLNLFKPMACSLILALVFQLCITHFFTSIAIGVLIGIFLLYYFLYALSLLLTQSFDKEDVQLIVQVFGILGVSEERVEGFISRMGLR